MVQTTHLYSVTINPRPAYQLQPQVGYVFPGRKDYLDKPNPSLTFTINSFR